jgi:hypothetical protein
MALYDPVCLTYVCTRTHVCTPRTRPHGWSGLQTRPPSGARLTLRAPPGDGLGEPTVGRASGRARAHARGPPRLSGPRGRAARRVCRVCKAMDCVKPGRENLQTSPVATPLCGSNTNPLPVPLLHFPLLGRLLRRCCPQQRCA